MKCSVIVVSYNTADLLMDCLESVYADASLPSTQVLVVDNASSDGSAQQARERFPDAEVVANQENMGFARANLQAFDMASGEYIVLLNPDARLVPGSLKKACEYMDAHADVGACGGRQTDPQGQLVPSARRFPCAWYKLLSMTGLAHRYADSVIFGEADFTWFSHDKVREVDWVPGSFVVFRKSALDKLGFFDPRYFMYYEETDLCLRLKRNGWRIMFIPWAEVVHEGGASSRKRQGKVFDDYGSQLLEFRMRSEALYFRKNYGLPSVLLNLGIEMGVHCLRWLVHLRPDGSQGDHTAKRAHARRMVGHGLSALRDTRWGRVSPPPPW